MSRTTISAREFESALKALSTEIVWKDAYRSSQNEDSSYYFAVDRYMSASETLLTKYSTSFINDMLTKDKDHFYGNPSLGITAAIDSIFPESMNSAMREMYEYTEHNAYYRMLMGYPPIDSLTTEWIYPAGYYNKSTGQHYDENGERIPVHLWDYAERIRWASTSQYTEYINQYSGRAYEYLQHMTIKRIEPYLSRAAGRFELLYVPQSDPTNLRTDFIDAYGMSLDYMIRVFYTDAYRNSEGQFYEGFIGMSILFMAMNQMFYRYLDADIDRNFYDLDSLKIIYEAYGVPFYDSIPLMYHKRIVKKINQLIRYKGSNQVFVNLCDLFDYDILGVYQYYLFKERKFDANNNPLTYYTEKVDSAGNIVYNEDGTPVMVPDYKKMYNIFFLKTNINEDPYKQISQDINRTDYNSVVEADSYWFQDDIDTINAIYQNDYNYIETKYIGVQLMFNITDMLYESGYFMKMLFDNKASIRNLIISHDRMGTKIPLFDFILYIFAVICKKNGYEGNIPSKPSQVARVYGFNYKGIMQKMKEASLKGFHIEKDYEPGEAFHKMDIAAGNTEFHGNDIQDWMEKNKWLIRSKEGQELYSTLINTLKNMVISDEKSVNTAYSALISSIKLLDKLLQNTHDRLEYEAYRDLKKIFYTTEIIDELYTKSDGTIASSYADLLDDVNALLWTRLQDLSTEDITTEIDYCLVTLKKYATDLKYLEYIDSVDINIITEYLYKMLRFFKSAKADLVDFNVVFRIDSRTENVFKLLEYIHSITETIWLDEDIQYIIDEINRATDSQMLIDKQFVFRFTEFLVSTKDLYRVKENLVVNQGATNSLDKLADKIVEKIEKITMKEDSHMEDYIACNQDTAKVNDFYAMTDVLIVKSDVISGS